MTAEDRGRETDGRRDPFGDGTEPGRFEQELVVRLAVRAGEVGGGPPPAGLREAGRRRARRRRVARSGSAAVVLVLGAGLVTQLGGSGQADGTTALGGVGLVSPSPSDGARGVPWTPGRSPSSSSSTPAEAMFGTIGPCVGGPATRRLPPWTAAASTRIDPAREGTPFVPSTTGKPSSGLPVPSSSVPVPSSSAPVPGSGSPSGHGLLEASVQVRRLGALQFPDQYFGVCSDFLTNEVFVQRVAGSGLDQAVLREVSAPGATFRFVDVPGSLRHFQELRQRILDDAGYWTARGVTVEEVVISEDGAGVQVYSPQALTARAEIVARYGPEVLEVRPD
ncbi:hypothetical protein [Streptomyces sp. NRRL S-495]|uniref:hypothetical protein n=1 Tax=Streptomyces sp. NRRL S-495 TaxID=1609133 RepID=UPI000697BF53|nr:hypothetical protein [Streptomyces sp. NRRL S-495]